MNGCDQSKKAKDIFADALALTSLTERGACLERACAGNPALREEVESLLRAHDQAEGFLQPPVSPSAAQQTMLIPRLTEMTGTRIGRYKLLERIGEVGMGVVWMAEQEEPVRRRVALKIIKLGLSYQELVGELGPPLMYLDRERVILPTLGILTGAPAVFCILTGNLPTGIFGIMKFILFGTRCASNLTAKKPSKIGNTSRRPTKRPTARKYIHGLTPDLKQLRLDRWCPLNCVRFAYAGDGLNPEIIWST